MPRPDPKAVKANWKALCDHVNNFERCLLQLCAHPEADPVKLAEAIAKYREMLLYMQETLPKLEQQAPRMRAPFYSAWDFYSISGRVWRVARRLG